MQLIFFSRTGWQGWDVAAEPAFPDRMPVLADDDLLFEDAGVPRPSVAVNRWLRELPISGSPSPGTWAVYARAMRSWLMFLACLGVAVFDTRHEVKRALGAYAANRASGPVQFRFAASTWNQHISVLSSFYQWAVAEGHASAVPFSYAQALSRYGDQVRLARANLARRRAPKPHVTIKYLEADFAAMFLSALAGLAPDGTADAGYRGREMARNTAMAGLALATGLRRREFTFLLVFEVPSAPPASHPPGLPVLFPVPSSLAKGGKYRTTWIDAATLHAVHGYIGLDRAASTAGSAWSPPARLGEPLLVTDPGPDGGRVNGRRVKWASLTAAERLRLVAPGGGAACWRCAPTGARSPRGRACSPAPPSGSGHVSSRGSRWSIRTGCGIRWRWRRWNAWWAASTPRPRSWPRPPAAVAPVRARMRRWRCIWPRPIR